MPFHDGGLSFRNDPLVNSVFTQDFQEQGGEPPPVDESFRLQIKTNNSGTSGSTQYHLPIVNGAGHSFDFIVDWGDGSTDHITDANQGEALHTYAMAGTYDVFITGQCYGVTFQFRDPLKVLNISNWGNIRLTQGTAGLMFSGCANLTITATDVLDLTGVTSFNQAFLNCSALTTVPKMYQWQTGNITTFAGCFTNCTLFNTPLDGWDLHSAVNLSSMFLRAIAFNQSLNSWDVSHVTNFSNMFGSTAGQPSQLFNGDISSWDVSSGQNFSQMFARCVNFNVDIGGWITSAATNMSSMFARCSSFNKSLGTWNVQNVTNMSGLFSFCTVYNQSVNTWSTTSLINTSSMFSNCPAYNQPMDAFHFGLVTNASGMFSGASSFNQDISGWSTNNCQNFSLFLLNATSFNSHLNGWGVGACSDFNNMFNGATSFNKPLSLWNINPAQNPDMSQMFMNATSFDQDISAWDVSGTVLFDLFMSGATAFSTANYDALLIAWAALTVQEFINIEFASEYTPGGAAEAARNTLTTTYSWTITDGGPA